MDAFQGQIVELMPRLRRLARALARDHADADDLTQLTLERALQRRGQWQAGTRLDSWVFRIMRNAWIDEARSRGRQARVFEPPTAGETVADPAAPDMETRLAAREVERAMAELPEDQRLAVALVLVDGLSYREAAEVMETPVGTLTSRLVRGRMALLARLQGAEVQP
ncbi:MAG TPA: sigma-70 family RNA polymerase sigma factor [Caulobacteraceae bacterium]|nr:sigma-70 family RNA polymerase sigma factor [Caulobacteraceae bacterium]